MLGRVVWEFEWKGHFSAYDADCQDYMEKKYQAHSLRKALERSELPRGWCVRSSSRVASRGLE